jgi:hypothetical protein
MYHKISFWLFVGLAAVVLCSNASAAGLVGWWTFDETSGNTAKDSSGKGNDGRIVGNAKWVPGKIGGALEFDGSTYVDCGNKPSLNVREQITMSFWFKVKAFQNTWEAFLAKGDGAYRASRSAGTGNSVHMGITGGNYFDATAPIVTDDQWHHYAGIYDGTTATIYVDGVQAAQRTYGGQIGDSSNYNFYIGENAQATGRMLHGLMDDVRIYDRALTEQQLLDLITSGVGPSWKKAEKPVPANGATGIMVPLLQWSPGESAKLHNVYLGTSPDLTAANLVGPRLPMAMFYYAMGLTPGTTYYWRIDEIEADGKTTYTGDLWSFTAAPTSAFAPNPRSGDKWIAVDVTLVWQPGQGATAHEVYFGTDKDAVANRDASAFQGKQVAPSYTPGALNENTKYYWAVDEITGTGTKNVGDLWSFTTFTPGGGVKGEYFNGMTPSGMPALTRIDPAIDFSWGDPGGPGAPVGVDQFSARWTADLDIAIADSYTFITSSDDGVRLWLGDEQIVDNWTDHGTADNYSTPIALEPGIYPLRMEYYENGGGAVARLFWQTPSMARQIIPAGPLQPPVRARALYPTSGDVNIPQDVTLMWGAGEKALQHQVYFGEDAEAVANATPDSSGIYKGQQALDKNTFDPGTLEWNKTYYWRVDEVNDAATGSPWKGAVWSFTTADFIVVDNFESYNDEVDKGTRIYETWIDGQTNLTTSTVGNWDPPFAEQTIVHGGRQSMPVDYNNINSPFYAEAEREFSPLQNWTVNGVTDLSLFFRGRPAAFVEGADGAITMSGSGHDIWDAADDFRFACKRLNGDGSIVARVDSVANTNAWAKAGLMIRETLDGGAKMAYMVVTPGSGVSFGWRTTADATPEQVNNAVITAPQWVKLTRKGDVFTAQYSADGNAWTDLPKADGTPVSVLLTGSVYIGLCVTSHDAALVTTATFSNITAGGTGAWQVAAVGDDPEPANSPQSLYLVVEDSAGKSKVITHPDAGAANVTAWTEWKIPLGDLAGVNLAKVKKLYIGVGDRANPAADGSGRIYIDDIRVTKPQPAGS